MKKLPVFFLYFLIVLYTNAQSNFFKYADTWFYTDSKVYNDLHKLIETTEAGKATPDSNGKRQSVQMNTVRLVYATGKGTLLNGRQQSH